MEILGQCISPIWHCGQFKYPEQCGVAPPYYHQECLLLLGDFLFMYKVGIRDPPPRRVSVRSAQSLAKPKSRLPPSFMSMQKPACSGCAAYGIVVPLMMLYLCDNMPDIRRKKAVDHK